jgi:DNA mismatch repair protein MutS
MAKDLTPIRQQYLEIKKQYPNAIVFFRLGDFYETFDEDATITSQVLDIVLTSRPVAKGVRVPMAGIPYHAAENYLGRLIEHGYHVAIAEQVGDQPDKGLFSREVVRVVTPGTVVEPGLLPSAKNNYLASVYIQENKAGIAYLDITTGEFAGTQIEGEDVQAQMRSELMRINPSETLHSEAQLMGNSLPGTQTPVPNWYYEPGRAEELMKSAFGVSSLDGFGLHNHTLTVQAAGALLKYLQETHRDALKALSGFTTYSLADFMVLDAETRRNLELTETLRENKVEGSLLSVLDNTRTPMGKRVLLQWVNKTLLNLQAINSRLDMVEFFFQDGVLRKQVSELLAQFHDLERLINRISSQAARPPDLTALREDFALLPQLLELLPSETPALQPILGHLQVFAQE